MKTQIEYDMLGQSAEFESIQRTAKIMAATDVTVLIQGESGTGKELMAKFIHTQSSRHSSPLVTINCAALPETLAESALFGHAKGSFTDATCDQQGRIQSAHNGTLFLDEVGELPLNIQAKLLRFLENGECQTIGQTKTEKVNVRVIAATNRDLYKEVENGNFREDLFYRLNVVPLEIPSLRERKSDIELLINHLSAQVAVKHRLNVPRFSVKAIEHCQRYTWPGNIRELKNFCERMVILLNGKTINIENLPLEMRVEQKTKIEAPFTLPEGGVILEQLEAQLISQAMDKSHGNQSKAARLLGLTRSALLYRLNKYSS
ncbi:MAG: sigma-54 dependent transcriptional regulator [Gammaproteobacteria bacterium]|nr:sigma-54 dependent transcriptional regulator [Gammaproteobacteria bacterium]MCW8986761.1 sigma-54 dependent transcriptional regulator [Gammaproteobacteria bacterium]